MIKGVLVAALMTAGQLTPVPSAPTQGYTPVQSKTCKTVSSCRDAVVLWCGGYSRADADGDGIPCENVCKSRQQVDAIRKQIGC